MATIKPFRGMRYNLQIVDPSKVISQPYDRVRYGLQQQYYDASPYNIVRIVKGRELSTDVPDRPEGPNAYTRARAYYELWQAEEVLVQEPKPAIYVYHQTFAVAGQRRTRKAFIAAFELSRFDRGIVLPHEQTHAGPKIDRLRLLRAIEANSGQIFMLYPDPENAVSALLDEAIAGREPDIDATEMHESSVRQQLWVVADAAAVRAVQQEMSKRNLIVADGHHRYETAINYRDEMRARYPGAPPNAAFNYRMVTMVSMNDPGLTILPTHREVIDLPQFTLAEALARATAFEITPVVGMDACLAKVKAHQDRHAFGLYAEGKYHVLVLRSPALIQEQIAGDRSPAWKSLDVTIAHRILLERVIGLSAEGGQERDNLRYHRDPALGIENVDAARGTCVLFLNPTRIQEVMACATRGEKMPQKSTDFYPKMVSGLAVMPIPADGRI